MIVGSVMIAWALIASLYTYYTNKLVNTPAQFSFFIFYTLYLLLAFSFWEGDYDPKDIIATYLFFVFIPILVVNLHSRHSTFELAINHALRAFFLLFSLAIFYHAFRYGIDWTRPTFFNLDFFHKNGVSAIYEIVYIYILFKNKKSSKKVISLIIFIGMSCIVIIGSKTTFGLATLFTIGFFSRSLFVVLSLITLGVLVYLVFFFEDYSKSPFRTASYRGLLWRQAWKEIVASKTTFFLGNGPGSFVSTVKEYDLFGMEGTHNYILQIMHNYGLSGLLVFGVFFRNLWKRFGLFASPAAVAFWMFNLHALFDVGWIKGTGFFASLFLGIAIVIAIVQKNDKKEPLIL